jgi:hypothetical protein
MRSPRLGDTCYWFNNTNAYLTYNQAEMVCRAHGGDLAHLLSSDLAGRIGQQLYVGVSTVVIKSERKIILQEYIRVALQSMNKWWEYVCSMPKVTNKFTWK